MASEKLTFTGHDGRTELAARLDMPTGPHLATALFAHCFTCGKDIHAARRIAARLAAHGIAVLRFDFTGLGHSGGEFANTTFTSNVGDLEAAADALAERGMPPQLVIGHSLGGAAVLKAARQMDSARAVVTIGAPFDPDHVTHNFGDALDRIEADGAAEVNLGGRPIRVGQDFVRDVSATELAPAITDMRRALLIMHAPRDTVVGIDNATRIFTAARHPKSFVSLDSADHLVSNASDAEYAASVIAAWAERYIELDHPAAAATTPEGVTRVSEADPAGFLQDISTGAHHILADEPEKAGGTDRGHSPYGLLAAALGACTSMTIRMYARRKKWPLDHVRVDVSHDKVHAQDCEDCEKGARVDRFHRAILLEGALDDDQRARLIEIADRCPVHRTLESRAEVDTEEVADPAPQARAG
ncbi:osmotically inducible protein C [Rhodobacteraceae bacterium WD3A24]|nr:osmotically inducible protein C [Rhodobacteraceae bacterium WD3A24]